LPSFCPFSPAGLGLVTFCSRGSTPSGRVRRGDPCPSGRLVRIGLNGACTETRPTVVYQRWADLPGRLLTGRPVSAIQGEISSRCKCEAPAGRHRPTPLAATRVLSWCELSTPCPDGRGSRSGA
jgi:hypothetical protein